jgi:beta-lactamase regulating signal transducer with metallopeptidase domain
MTTFLAVALLRTTVAVTIAVLVVRFLLWRLRITSPRVHRVASVLALLPGWAFAPMVIAVPWYSSITQPALQQHKNNTDPPTQSATAFHHPLVSAGATLASGADQGPTHQVSGSHRKFAWSGIRLSLLHIWLYGLVSCSACYGLVYLATWLLTRRQLADDSSRQRWRTLVQDLNGPTTLPLQFTRVAGPMLCLFPRGYEFWTPRAFWLSITDGQQRAIARHELSHWRRGDVWKSWLVRILALPQWFNPAAWWAIQSFDAAGEWLCDADATPDDAAKADYLAALMALIEIQKANTSRWTLPFSTYPVAGHCAHAHPLVVRVRRLLSPVTLKDSRMNQQLMLVSAALLALIPMIRVDLVARAADPPAVVQTVHEQMKNLDSQLESLKEDIKKLKDRGESLKTEIEGRAAALKELRESPDKLSDELKALAAKFHTGVENDQLSVVDSIGKLGGEEQVLALGLMCKETKHESVRRKAIVAICEMGDLGIPAVAMAYEGLSTKEKCFLAEELNKKPSYDRLIVFAGMAKDADEELLKALLALKMDTKSKLSFLAVIADAKKDSESFAQSILDFGDKTEGDDGVMVLYAIAKSGEDKHVAKAVELAVKRKEAGYPVIAAAFKKGGKESRFAVVKASKQIGGDAGKFVVEKALAEEDPELRAAAEKANSEN